MKFLTLYADIDKNYFSRKTKAANSIKSIDIAEYIDKKLINKYHWDISTSKYPKPNNELLYLHEAWKEIDPLINNNTVFMFDANFTYRLIVKTFQELIKMKDPDKKPPDNKRFPGLIKKLNAIKFDYFCVSLIYRRLFKDIPNKINELCDLININTENYSTALADMVFYVMDKTKCNDFIELKHICGITIGQAIKTIYPEDKDKNSIITFDEYYYPCIPITDEGVFNNFEI